MKDYQVQPGDELVELELGLGWSPEVGEVKALRRQGVEASREEVEQLRAEGQACREVVHLARPEKKENISQFDKTSLSAQVAELQLRTMDRIPPDVFFLF